MDKQDKIKQILENAIRQADALTATQAKQLIELLVGITVKNKEDIRKDYERFADTVSQETFQKIQEAISILSEKANDNQLEVRQLTNKQKKLFEEKIASLEILIEDVLASKPENGKDADEVKIVKEVLSKIPKQPKYQLLGENVVDSINALSVIPENQIDAKHIKNLPKLIDNRVGGVVSRNIYQLDDVKLTSVANNDTLKYNSTTKKWENGAGGGGGTWGSITGTLSSQTDLQNALNAKLDDSQATAFGLSLLDDADATAGRTTLGLGTLATQSGTFSGTSSGTNTGDQTITNSSDATSHTVTLSASGGSVQLIEGANITITTGGTGSAGTVTIASTASGGLTWTTTTVDATMVVANGYIANKGTLLTMTLPTTSAVGTTVRVAGMNAGLWKIAQASSQYIKFGNQTSTTGVTGYISSVLTYDAVELVCIEANLGWVVVSSVGNITVV